jgi:large subunit ribosomal protein L24
MNFGSNLSKDLRGKYSKRSAKPRKGDTVKILRGEFKGIEGKVTAVNHHKGTITVEGVTKEKIAGGTSPVPINASKVMITNLVLEDKLRKKKLEGE